MALVAMKAGTFSLSNAGYYDFSKPQPFHIYGSDVGDFYNLAGWEPPAGTYYDVHGGKGNDTIFGSNSRDILRGDEGDDFIDGGLGNDEIHGGVGKDVLYGGAGMDTIYGGDGDDVIEGGGENDSLLGGNGRDTLRGGEGHDFLDGGKDFDVLIGGNGNDQLTGGLGQDTLTGGLGADRFVFNEWDYTSTDWLFWTFEHPLHDLVTDFSAAGGDTIDLSGLFDRHVTANLLNTQDALLQGYIYFKEYGTPGSGEHGTYIMFDKTGGADGHDWWDDTFFIADIQGVRAAEIPLTSIII